MTTLMIGGPGAAVASFAPGGIVLPCAVGLTVLHVTTSTYKTGTSLQNLAGTTALASTVNGAPTFTTSGFTINTAGTDFLTTQYTDNGGDITGYCVMKNLDTLAGNTTSPVLLSNYNSDAAHGAVVAGSKGVQFHVTSTTAVTITDFELVSGASTVKNANGTLTAASLNSGTGVWHAFAFTIATVGTTVTLTFYDLTDGTTATNTTSSTQRQFNLLQPFLIGTNASAASCGLMSMAFLALAQTAAGAGGAHTAAQIAQNYASIKALMANLPVPITC
jgi:hypothetical protein